MPNFMNSLYKIVEDVPQQTFAARGPGLQIEVDNSRGIVRIEGVNYAFDFFKALAYGVMKGEIFEMGERKDGVVEIRRVILEKPSHGLSGVMAG